MDGDLAVFIMGVILSAVGCILCAGVLVFNLKYMNLRYIKMTSPKVNLLLVLGALSLYSCCLFLALPSKTWPLRHQAIIQQVQYSVLTAGMTVTFSSMLMKGWRVYRLFQYPRIHTLTIKDCSLLAGILALCFLDVILSSCWALVDPIVCVQRNSTVGPAQLLGEVVCTSEHISAWLLAIILYKYMVMMLCCYIGWQIRQITFSALDDSRCLLLGPGITLTLFGVITSITLLFPKNSTALSAVMSASVWIGTTAILITIFYPKMMKVFKSGNEEPLMCSASKYVKQPTSDDVETELVKVLGENRYLKQKLEESDSLINHLKRTVAHTIPADYDSQQTSSANYSVTTATTTTLISDRGSPCSSLTYCLFACCCDTSDQSVKAKQGTPVTDRDLSIKTVPVLTTPNIVQQECYDCTYNINQCKSVDDYGVAQSEKPLVMSSATTHDCDRVVTADPQMVDNQSMEAIDFNNVCITNGQCAGAKIQEDLDLICSIADAYDLGGDSDTFSFISNYLYNTSGKNKAHQSSTLSLQRRKRFSRVSFSQSSMLGSDQLYPDSGSAMKPQSQSSKGRKKFRKAQSVATTDSTASANVSNVYVNDEGNPIIL